MILNYNGIQWIVKQITDNLYRCYNAQINIYIVFEIEYKSGLYFHISNIYKGNRNYIAQRYFYKYISVIREAAYLIAQTDGIYNYSDNKFYKAISGKYISI